MSPSPGVVALVVLKPANPRLAKSAGPVRAANVRAHQPDSERAEILRRTFAEMGFQVGPLVGTSFSIEGARTLFETRFGVRLEIADQQPARVADRDDGALLPLSRLPEKLRREVEAITFGEPMSFGPGGGFS